MNEIMTREEWLNAGREAQQREHPSGWSYRNDTRRLLATLERYYVELGKIRTSMDNLKILGEFRNIEQSLERLGVTSVKD